MRWRRCERSRRRAAGTDARPPPARGGAAGRCACCPELPAEVVAPAVGPAVRHEGAGVAASRAHAAIAQPTRDQPGLEPPGRRTVAELAGVVAAPAVGQPVRGDAAGVRDTYAYGAEAKAAEDGNRDRTARPVGFVAGADVGPSASADAERPASVRPPAIGPIVGGDAARVVEARAHDTESQSPDHGSRPRDTIVPVHAELEVVHTVAHLSGEAAAPAVGPVVCRHTAGVLVARAQLPDTSPVALATTDGAASVTGAVGDLASSLQAGTRPA